MRILLLILTLMAVSAHANNISGTLTTDTDTGSTVCTAGEGNVSIVWSAGTGTVKVQFYHDVNGWTDLENASWTAANSPVSQKIDYGAPVSLRLNLASASGATIPWEIRCK